jgi:hypothetical protein
MKLAIAIIIAMIIIPLISFFTSKLKSLPVQFVCSSISITVLALEVFAQLTKSSQLGADAGYSLFLGILALTICSVISLAGYIFHNNDSTEKNKFVKDFAYVYSLFTSCFALIFAYVFVSKADLIFSSSFEKPGALTDLYNDVFSDQGGFDWIIIVSVFIFISAIIARVVTDGILITIKKK